jgi:hypothetical protein
MSGSTPIEWQMRHPRVLFTATRAEQSCSNPLKGFE